MIEGKILIIDDESSLRELLRILLQRRGYQVEVAANGEEGLRLVDQQEFDVVFTDLKMPGTYDGLGVLEVIRDRAPATQVIVITAFATTETAIRAIKMGAYDYVQKPFKNEEIEALVAKCLEKRALLKENVQLRSELQSRYTFGHLLGKSKKMGDVFGLLRKVVQSNVNVLITGENGTGKELVARALHYNGPRRKRHFFAVNCGAIPEALLESELFGHEKGSFTGADRQKPGLFRSADGSTLFLDEIADLPLHTQVKLLRVLEEREVRPIGGTRSVSVDVRIVSATNKNLQQEVEQGRFREDLYFRLKVMTIEMPPLRERPEDIPFLAQHFLEHFASETSRELHSFTHEAMEYLLRYPFRGNVRELKNIVERAVLLEVGPTIQLQSLPPEVRSTKAAVPTTPEGEEPIALPAEGIEAYLESIERQLLLQALQMAHGVRKKAAKLLQISFRSFRYRVAKLGISDEEIAGEDDDSSR